MKPQAVPSWGWPGASCRVRVRAELGDRARRADRVHRGEVRKRLGRTDRPRADQGRRRVALTANALWEAVTGKLVGMDRDRARHRPQRSGRAENDAAYADRRERAARSKKEPATAAQLKYLNCLGQGRARAVRRRLRQGGQWHWRRPVRRPGEDAGDAGAPDKGGGPQAHHRSALALIDSAARSSTVTPITIC
jgi:hypothetical protein